MKTVQQFLCPECGFVMNVELDEGEKREVTCHGCYHEEWVPPVPDETTMVMDKVKNKMCYTRFKEDGKKVEHGCRFTVVGK